MTASTIPAADSPRAPAAYGIIAALVAVAVVAAGGAFGLRDRTADVDGSAFDVLGATTVAAAPTAPPVATTSPPPGVTAATTVPTTAPPTTVADAGRVPTKDDPLRLYIAGDSDAHNMGPPLMREIEKTGLVKSELHYKISSGLTRPDFYNWPETLKSDMAKINPDVVVVTFGGNDAQDLIIKGRAYQVDSVEWQTEYADRVGAVMDYLSSEGRTLIWVGIPNAKSDDYRARLQVLEQVTRAEAAKRPKVVYIPVWDLFVGVSGGYAASMRDPRDGIGKQVRNQDGFHLNVAGSEILGAYYVAAEVRKELLARGAT
jgi:uncharacterized protein